MVSMPWIAQISAATLSWICKVNGIVDCRGIARWFPVSLTCRRGSFALPVFLPFLNLTSVLLPLTVMVFLCHLFTLSEATCRPTGFDEGVPNCLHTSVSCYYGLLWRFTYNISAAIMCMFLTPCHRVSSSIVIHMCFYTFSNSHHLFFSSVVAALSKKNKCLPRCFPPFNPIMRYLSAISNAHLSYVILYIISPSRLGSSLKSFLSSQIVVIMKSCSTLFCQLFLLSLPFRY